MLGHLRAHRPLTSGGVERKRLGDGTGDRAIHIEILGYDELRIGRCRTLENGGVHGRQKRGPVSIGRVDTVVDDGRILAHLACESLVGSIAFHDFDALRGRSCAAAIDQANAPSLPVEFVHHSETTGSGAKDDMQFIVGNHRVLSSHQTYRVSLEYPNEWYLLTYERYINRSDAGIRLDLVSFAQVQVFTACAAQDCR